MEWAGPDLLTVCTAGLKTTASRRVKELMRVKHVHKVKLHISNVPSIAEAQEIQRERRASPTAVIQACYTPQQGKVYLNNSNQRGMDMLCIRKKHGSFSNSERRDGKMKVR